MAQLEAVNLRASTVTLAGEVYLVSDATRMVDWAGRGTSLDRLRPRPAGSGLVADSDVDAVRWQAVETRTGWVLTDLEIMKKLPD
jgi:hypothetical protein